MSTAIKDRLWTIKVFPKSLHNGYVTYNNIKHYTYDADTGVLRIFDSDYCLVVETTVYEFIAERLDD